MNDDARCERLFEEGLTDLAPARAPDRLTRSIKIETSPMRPRPRWLALIKEPPMSTSSRLAVGSSTLRVAAIAVATLLIAAMVIGASFAGANLLAADDSIIVDGAGGAAYSTITAAAAEDGDEIRVRPGMYVEAVIIDKDITLTGDGPVEDIVITAPEDGPTALAGSATISEPYAVLLVDSTATVSDLTFRGEPSEVLVQGGSPTLDGLVLDGVGWAFDTRGTSKAGSSIAISGGSMAQVMNNELRGGGPIAVFGGSTPSIEGNTLSGGPHVFLDSYGDGTSVAGNTIDGSLRWAIGGFDHGALTIDGNDITNSGDIGINMSTGQASEGVAVLTGNKVSGAIIGGISADTDNLQVIGNTLVGNGIGIGGSGLTLVEGNEVHDGGAGIVLIAGSPVVKDNVVTGMSRFGLSVGADASAALSGNTSCDNGQDLRVAPGAAVDDDGTNEICEPTAAE